MFCGNVIASCMREWASRRVEREKKRVKKKEEEIGRVWVHAVSAKATRYKRWSSMENSFSIEKPKNNQRPQRKMQSGKHRIWMGHINHSQHERVDMNTPVSLTKRFFDFFLFHFCFCTLWIGELLPATHTLVSMRIHKRRVCLCIVGHPNRQCVCVCILFRKKFIRHLFYSRPMSCIRKSYLMLCLLNTMLALQRYLLYALRIGTYMFCVRTK